ncbi:PREDICTED: serine/arginine repetitive matrix protein 1 [Colobus angolensis palliatus]|uniref:serine/arginine repetitive matrix protein 1 n=1 Tax=Colobus angolensis palliatus TaxID=336983 RepID=UPI0005F3D7BC|nr:PREDICTED: serine/arginine repetitive matrix protein 1 [Colobus angolensis palliatus]
MHTQCRLRARTHAAPPPLRRLGSGRSPEDRGAPDVADSRAHAPRSAERSAAAQETWAKLVASAGRLPRRARRGRGRCQACGAAWRLRCPPRPASSGSPKSAGASEGARSERSWHGPGDGRTRLLGEPGEFPLRLGDSRLLKPYPPSSLAPPVSPAAGEEHSRGRCWGGDSSPPAKKKQKTKNQPADWGFPIGAPCPEPRRQAGAPVFVLISIAALCVLVARLDTPPPPPPLPPPGPPPRLPHPHLLLSNEKVTEENPNTPAAKSPLWHLAARGGGLLGSTWWSLRDATLGDALHLRENDRGGGALCPAAATCRSSPANATGDEGPKERKGPTAAAGRGHRREVRVSQTQPARALGRRHQGGPGRGVALGWSSSPLLRAGSDAGARRGARRVAAGRAGPRGQPTLISSGPRARARAAAGCSRGRARACPSQWTTSSGP